MPRPALARAPRSSVASSRSSLVASSRSSLVVTLACAVASLFVTACEPARTCYEGDFQTCECANGDPGFAACDVAKDEYGACSYCGVAPGSAVAAGTGGAGATSSGGAGSGGAPLLGFMETCKSDEECATGLCHTFNAKGPKCTQPCATDGDCPEPSPGCNNMGVCKAP